MGNSLQYVQARCLAEPDTRTDDVLGALDFADEARSTITAATLAEYVDAWLRDLATWRRFVVGLPLLGHLDASLRYLEIPAVFAQLAPIYPNG
jgi:hypothetical protein